MATMAYETTTVSVDKSRSEIRNLLLGFGIGDIQFTELASTGTIAVRFRYEGFEVDFKVAPHELLSDLVKAHPRTNKTELAAQSEKIMWRQLYYYLKAALTAIRYRVRTPQEILLSAIALPGGTTVGEAMHEILPQLTAGQLCLPNPDATP